MAKKIISRKDNTSDMLKDELKNRTNVNASNRRELAIKLFEEEENNMMTDLNVATCKTKLTEDDKYREKFVSQFDEIKRNEMEWEKQKKMIKEVDKELAQLAQLELQCSSAEKTEKAAGGISSKLTFKNIEYNNLINEQNQIKRQTDSALKQHNGIQQMYNLLMNKLNKGKHLASVLSELVMRIQTYKNEAKERLEMYLKTTEKQVKVEENNLDVLEGQLYSDRKLTEFLLVKHKKRQIKYVEKPKKNETDLVTLNAEAEIFLNHLRYISEEKDLKKITVEIIGMDLDNRSMFNFITALELQLTEVENELKQLRITVEGKMREVSDLRAAKSKRLESMEQTYRDGCAPLREARETLRLMSDEWRETCKAVDEICDEMGVDRSRPLDISMDGKDDHHRTLLNVADIAPYFVPVESRVNDMLNRLFHVENNRNGDLDGDSGFSGGHLRRKQPTDVGDFLSSGSELEDRDDFIARDLDCSKNRRASMMVAVDPTAVPVDIELLDIGHVPSICPECLEKRLEDDQDNGMRIRPPSSSDEELDVEVDDKKMVTGPCDRQMAFSLEDIEKKGLQSLFHRIEDCPLAYRKRRGK